MSDHTHLPEGYDGPTDTHVVPAGHNIFIVGPGQMTVRDVGSPFANGVFDTALATGIERLQDGTPVGVMTFRQGGCTLSVTLSKEMLPTVTAVLSALFQDLAAAEVVPQIQVPGLLLPPGVG